jgi:hypothetical protein
MYEALLRGETPAVMTMTALAGLIVTACLLWYFRRQSDAAMMVVREQGHNFYHMMSCNMTAAIDLMRKMAEPEPEVGVSINNFEYAAALARERITMAELQAHLDGYNSVSEEPPNTITIPLVYAFSFVDQRDEFKVECESVRDLPSELLGCMVVWTNEREPEAKFKFCQLKDAAVHFIPPPPGLSLTRADFYQSRMAFCLQTSQEPNFVEINKSLAVDLCRWCPGAAVDDELIPDEIDGHLVHWLTECPDDFRIKFGYNPDI